MARYTGPKDRLSRREGFDLFGAGAKLTRLVVPPGMHGQKRLRRLSEYGRQLREKQKVRRMYGILERQFAGITKRALATKGNTGEALLELLERRLDNTVFRLGFAPTRASARQIVSHGHLKVDGKRVNIASYEVKVGQVLSLSKKAQEIAAVRELIENSNLNLPPWLERKGGVGRVVRLPKREDLQEPISEADVIQYYSR